MSATSISFTSIEELFQGQKRAFNDLLEAAIGEFSSHTKHLRSIDFDAQHEDLRFVLHKIKGVTKTFQLSNLLGIINQIQEEIHHNKSENVAAYKPVLIAELDVVVAALQSKHFSINSTTA